MTITPEEMERFEMTIAEAAGCECKNKTAHYKKHLGEFPNLIATIREQWAEIAGLHELVNHLQGRRENLIDKLVRQEEHHQRHVTELQSSADDVWVAREDEVAVLRALGAGMRDALLESNAEVEHLRKKLTRQQDYALELKQSSMMPSPRT